MRDATVPQPRKQRVRNAQLSVIDVGGATVMKPINQKQGQAVPKPVAAAAPIVAVGPVDVTPLQLSKMAEILCAHEPPSVLQQDAFAFGITTSTEERNTKRRKMERDLHSYEQHDTLPFRNQMAWFETQDARNEAFLNAVVAVFPGDQEKQTFKQLLQRISKDAQLHRWRQWLVNNHDKMVNGMIRRENYRLLLVDAAASRELTPQQTVAVDSLQELLFWISNVGKRNINEMNTCLHTHLVALKEKRSLSAYVYHMNSTTSWFSGDDGLDRYDTLFYSPEQVLAVLGMQKHRKGLWESVNDPQSFRAWIRQVGLDNWVTTKPGDDPRHKAAERYKQQMQLPMTMARVDCKTSLADAP